MKKPTDQQTNKKDEFNFSGRRSLIGIFINQSLDGRDAYDLEDQSRRKTSYNARVAAGKLEACDTKLRRWGGKMLFCRLETRSIETACDCCARGSLSAPRSFALEDESGPIEYTLNDLIGVVLTSKSRQARTRDGIHSHPEAALAS
ncbi:hypothetical protein EVAR_95099_1 [Eumeta japonica]|uniref:Uncharacterized protein n=1 Tax=Eumeta variegata TaxID=151549 RepID=A0A4C1W938_EUMVA|nr:hypothetical protein EVAR_95099_1 [Eumeta japonica]